MFIPPFGTGSSRLPPHSQSAHIAGSFSCRILWKRKKEQPTTNNQRGETMAENKTQDYFDDNSEGHVDTRSRNFECDNKDPNLGCDMGIDVAG